MDGGEHQGVHSEKLVSGSDVVPSDEEREHLPTKRRKVVPYACDPSATSGSNEASPEPAAESSPDALPRNDRRRLRNTRCKYRYTAYRQFVWWVHGRLRKENRVTLPSCVVTRVRKEFPAPNPVDYTGFKQS
ncbi:hypothetical protein HPB47_002228 [Ixodes persulcatus]|uniref:Uncharacterized protein n=1 Tax=Ixodes persulcatus TaxID=34615 RepID=A0AC60PMR3_IXOPE|nr:hypothetical protein HPB47_002228 [Ixodes persulcatus]